MNEYTVYFEFYDKKMKTTVHATSEERAKECVRKNINFIKVEKQGFDILEEINRFKNIILGE